MIIVDPSTTALILVGASTFENYDDDDRESFLHARNAVKGYFLRERMGLDLPEANVRDLFDSTLSATEQIDAAAEFVRDNGTFRDVFVYVATHGVLLDKARQSENGLSLREHYLLKVRNSADTLTKEGPAPREETYIRFRTLYREIYGAGSMRLYVIVDACESGAVHPRILEHVVPPELVDRPIDSFSPVDRRGVAFLTANSRERLGLVYGADKKELPQFTAVLMELLEDGVKGGFNFGLSVSALAYLIQERGEKKALALEAPVSNSAQASYDELAVDGVPLSDVPIFPNNDVENAKFNALTSRVRRSFREASQERAKRVETETKNRELERAGTDLVDKLVALERRHRNLRWTAAFGIALPLLACAGLLVESPELRTLLADRFLVVAGS